MNANEKESTKRIHMYSVSEDPRYTCTVKEIKLATMKRYAK